MEINQVLKNKFYRIGVQYLGQKVNICHWELNNVNMTFLDQKFN